MQDGLEERFARIVANASAIREKLDHLLSQHAGVVHFRPTDGGITMVGLLPDRPQRGKGGYDADSLLRGFDAEFRANCVETPQGRPTPEKRLQSFLIADAYRHSRVLAALVRPDAAEDGDLVFVTDELAVDADSGKLVCDLLALRRGADGDVPVLLELKSSRQMSRLVAQLQDYSAFMAANAPLFERLFAEILGEEIRFGGPPERWLVWPGPCSGPDRREPELTDLGIGVIQYRDNGDGSVFHVGERPEGDRGRMVRSAPGRPAADALDARHGTGPQCAGDPPFTARMRLHQSWYRASVLRAPWGTGPAEDSTRELGSMLDRTSGAAGMNFLAPQAFEAAKQRIGDEQGLVEEYRLLHNMLSSQPMCFNLFGPLAADLDLATRVFRSILPNEVGAVTRIVFEHAPEPASDYLNDRTAFDAFVEFVRPGGGRGFVGIETKLTEPFSQKRYDGPAYRRWSDRPDSPWLPESRDRLADVRHNQLWRDHLLAVAMVLREGSPYACGHLMLVRHPLDEECAATAAGYAELLKPGDKTFVDCPIDRLVDTIETCDTERRQREWAAAFRRRYLDLSPSTEALPGRGERNHVMAIGGAGSQPASR